MHLEIVQPKSSRETVSVQIINKLYSLAYSNPNQGIVSVLDNTSTISGAVSLYAANKKRVEYLAGTNGVGGNGRFPDLLIYCTTYYIDFMDDAFATVCANVYGNGEGVTSADIAAVQSVTSPQNLLQAIQNNSDIVTLDFRSFPRMNLSGERNWNLPSLQSVYANSVSVLSISSFRNTGPITNNKYYLDKIIIGTLRYTDTHYTSFRVLQGATTNPNTFGTIAIRNFDPHDGVTKITVGNYTTRNNCTITNLYLGNSPFPLSYGEGYGDNLARISNIYVPVGMKQAYIDNGTWVHDGNARTDFIEYDFDTDPDGIFSVLDE